MIKFKTLCSGTVLAVKFTAAALCLTALQLSAQAEDLSSPEKTESLKVLRMGFTPSKGYLREQPDHTYEGLVYDYTEALSNYAKVKVNYIPCTQDECYAMLQHDKLDVVANVPATASDADPLLSLSRRAISSTVINMTRRKNFAKKRSFDSTWRYGFDENTLSRRVLNESLAAIGEEEGSQYVLIPYSDEKKMRNDYLMEDLDGLLFDSATAPEDIKVTHQLFRLKTYYAVKKSNEAILKILDTAADKLVLSAPTFRERLYENHLHNVQPLVLTDEEQRYLNSKKYFKVLVSPNQYPFSYFDQHGEHQGTLHYILSLFEQDLGIKFVYQQTTDYQQMLEALKSGDIDLIGDFNYDFNWAKQQQVRLTMPYIYADYVAIQKQGVPLPARPKIAMIDGYHYSNYIKNNLPHSNIISCQNAQDCLQAVSEGRADVTYMQSINARYTIEQGDFFSLYTPGQVIFSHAIAMALPPRTSDLMESIINKEVAHLKSQDLLSLQISLGFNQEANHSFKRMMYENKLMTACLVIVFLIILCTIIYLSLHKQRALASQAWRVLHYDERTQMPNLTLFCEQLAYFVLNPHKLKGADFYVMSITSKQFDLLRKAIDDENMSKGIAQVLSEMQKNGPFLELFGIDSERQIIQCLCKVPSNMSFDELASLMRNRLASFNYSGYNLHLNPNIGAIKVVDGYCAKELVTYADITLRESFLQHKPALLYAKDQFSNIVLYEKVETLVSKALYNHEFEILIQPKYDLQSRRCVGGEALVRWNSPELGHLTPGQFIEILEKNGLILELDYFMLDSVSELIATWTARNLTLVPISINHSGLHISEEGYLDKIKIISSKYHLPKNSLEIEITETAFVNYTTKSTRDDAQEIIDKLHAMGYKLSIDDFCTGYSSIQMLQSLTVDCLKIDRAILVEAHKSERAAAVLRNVVRLGADLNCQVICEGIETPEDEELLRQNGCLYGQGFLYGKPMRIPQFEEFIKQHA
ncbi:MAG: EAL domain-containing protein [Succinivibrio sp.]|nr:EAL domain-containing protein [Succinivibrio sp.]